ncbi:MAG TPA: SDR family oxidoreductase [Acidimicrobiales bacterium]|nr:SDR family oxidoreductase [Acidimicrobiales bacterium]
MDLRLDGKVAIVTGASKGIGLAIAAGFAEAGASVMITSRKADALEQAAATITPSGGAQVVWTAANAGDESAPDAVVAATEERLGPVDILVNNAATNPYFGPVLGISASQMDKTHQVNQRALVLWAAAAWRSSFEARGGSMINISSVGGMITDIGGIGYYNATKAAIIHLTRQLAAELAPTVRVNAIAPGIVKTDFARALWEPNEAAVANHVPLKRIGAPADITGAAVFLASDAASWITGHTLVVDGGLHLGAPK